MQLLWEGKDIELSLCAFHAKEREKLECTRREERLPSFLPIATHFSYSATALEARS